MSHVSKSLRRARDPEAGVAMVVVITILAALLAGGAVALTLQLGSTRQTAVVKSSKTAMYCAEAGLASARFTIQANYQLWNQLLDTDPDNDPSWYPIEGDIDDPPDGVNDYIVTVYDDDDDADKNSDINSAVFIRSRCVKYPQTPAEILELMSLSGDTHCYSNQKGACGFKGFNENQ